MKNLWKDFGVYLFCLAGTMVTKIIPNLQAEEVEIVLSAQRSGEAGGVVGVPDPD